MNNRSKEELLLKKEAPLLNNQEAKTMTIKDKNAELEEKLFRKKELQEEIQKKQFELAEINQAVATQKKEKKYVTNFDDLKVVTDGKNILETQVFHKNAIYEYFNEKNGSVTLFNGKQAEGVFGMDEKGMIEFGKKELGPVYQNTKEGFILRFKHFETY